MVTIIETLINGDFSDFQSRVIKYSSWEDYKNVLFGKTEENKNITQSTLGEYITPLSRMKLKEVEIDDNEIKHMKLIFNDNRFNNDVVLTSYLVEDLNLDFKRI